MSTAQPDSRPPRALAAGDRLGPYEITGFLGAGGMGEVYRAHDGRLDRQVALKVLRRASDAEHVARFSREARAAGALNHPNIVAVYDVNTAGGLPYVVTELLEGKRCGISSRNTATGRRSLWKTLVPKDAAGVYSVIRLGMTPSGDAYFYSYTRLLSQLFLVRGLK